MPKKQKSNNAKKEEKPEKLSLPEYKKRVIELAEKGMTAEKIGTELAKQGIHPKEQEIKISKILKEKKIYTIPELKNVETKLNKLEAHSKKNKQDKRAMREKERIFSQLRKIKKYHKSA